MTLSESTHNPMSEINTSSETSASRHILAPYCQGIGIDIGYGGDKVVPSAWAFDMPRPYTNVGGDTQQLQGDCRSLSFICDNALDYIYSSHVLEDFTYRDLIGVLTEWRRVLAPGGLLVTNCPDQQRFLAHCAATGQGTNDAHKEADFSMDTFVHNSLRHAGDWSLDFELDPFGNYSWLLVARKI